MPSSKARRRGFYQRSKDKTVSKNLLHDKREYKEQIRMRSGLERTVAHSLRAKKIEYQYETLKVSYTLTGNYIPDFVLHNGTILEVKGVLSTEDKRKMKAVKEQHPELDIRFVFADSDKKIPGNKQTHGQWAQKNGFLYCDAGEIPEDWLR